MFLLQRHRIRGFTILEFLLYTAGLLVSVQAVCVAVRLTMQVTRELPPYVDLVRMHLPAVRQLCRDRGNKEVVYALKKGCLYRKPYAGRRICIARGVAGVSGLPGQLFEQSSTAPDLESRNWAPGQAQGSVTYLTINGWHIEEAFHAPR